MGGGGRPVLRFVVAFAIAVALHTAWDSASATPVYVTLAAISLILLAVTVHRMHHRAPVGRPAARWRPALPAN